MISPEKWWILAPLQKLPNNVGDLGKIILATIFKWLPKVQKIAQSGYIDRRRIYNCLRLVWMSLKYSLESLQL